MPKRKSNQEFIAEAQINSKVSVLGEYRGTKNKVDVMCKKCGKIWGMLPSNILNGCGCSDCQGVSKKSHETFISEMVMLHPNIEVLGLYNTAITPVEVRCLVDGHVWSAVPNSFLNGQGCPKCGGTIKTTEEEFDHWMKINHPNIEVLGHFKSWGSKISVRCKVDGYQWDAFGTNLKNLKGCRVCAGNVKKTKEQFITELQRVTDKLEIIGEYVNDKEGILTRCKSCSHEWKPKPGKLLLGRGCPKCAKYGFDTEKPAEFYIYCIKDHVGFGITNRPKDRHRDHSRTFRNANVVGTLLHTIKFDSGEIAAMLEDHLKTTLPISSSGLSGFIKEAVWLDHVDLLYEGIRDFFISPTSGL